MCMCGARGSAVVEALRYKLEGHEIWPHYGPGVDLFSNINEYQEYFLGVKAAGA
jgi:hypothetical protein